MNCAKLSRSPRLQQVHELLRQGPQTTRDILVACPLCAAVSAAIAELRANGAEIEGRFLSGSPESGTRTYLYTMTRPAPRERRT